jgi:hypothetical protein
MGTLIGLDDYLSIGGDPGYPKESIFQLLEGNDTLDEIA